MNERHHRQIGIYRSRPAALRALDALQANGLPSPRLHLLHKEEVGQRLWRPQDNRGVAERLALGGLVGAALGVLMGGGLLLLVTLGGTGGSLRVLVALPVLGGLLGGLVGALLHAGRRLFGVAARIHSALERGRLVVVVHPRTTEEGRVARRLLGRLR